jgi:hypothetical protein
LNGRPASQSDAAVPQQLAPRDGPRPVGDGRAGQVDHRIQRQAGIQLVEAGDASRAAAQAGNFRRTATPYQQLMPLRRPQAAQRPADQAGTTGQQNAHCRISSSACMRLFRVWSTLEVPARPRQAVADQDSGRD